MLARARPSMLVLMALTVGCGPILGIEDTVYQPSSDPCALVPQRVFFAAKPTAALSRTLGAVTAADLAAVADALGVTLDPAAAHAIATISDCDGLLLEDADLSVEPPAVGATAFTVEESGVALGSNTSGPGLAGVLNLPSPAELGLEAYPDELGGELSSRGDIATVAGFLHNIVLEPNSEAEPLATPPAGFACVGETPALPADTSAVLTVTVHAATRLQPDGAPVAGIRVRYCLDNGEACAIDLSAPLDAGVEADTDDSGRATLSLPTPGEGFDGHLLLAGRVDGCQ